MKLVEIKDVTNNLDSKRVPLNSSQRAEKESNPLYPYIGANNIMGYIDEFIFDEKILCIAEDGGSWGYQETCSKIYDEKVWVNNHAHVLTAKDNLILEYLMYYLNYADLSLHINGATRGKLTKSSLNSIKIPLPPLPQQKKIGAILDAADAYRKKTKALIEKYEELTQSLFIDMFGDPVANPMGWEKVPFGNFITVLTDYHSNGSYESLRKVVTLKSEPDYALMVRTTDLENNNFTNGVNYIDEVAYNHLDKSKVFGGEIIINKIGSAGKVYRMPKLNRPVSLGMNAFLLRFNELIDDMFLYFQLVSPHGEREIKKRVKGAVTKTIRKDAVREVPLISPPLELQNQFAGSVQAIEVQKAQAQASLAQAEDLFNSLLQKAFKGGLTN
ncbi:restriction endonuclease subunit S [Crocinitomicaceae bacterium]|nr:restriction endonuclease subunit S [Crocinitomicaceae bacterium]